MPFHPQARDSLAQHQLDAELAILRSRPQAEAIPRHRSEEISLGKMRTLVGQHRLRSHQHDLARETAIPQPGGDRVPGRAAADDQRSGRCFSSSRRRRRDQAR